MDVRMYADEKTHEKIKVLASIRKVKIAGMLDEIVNYYIQANNYSVIFKEIENKNKNNRDE
jgi:hypothetical protein